MPSEDRLLVHVSAANAASLEREVEWLTAVLEARISLYFEQPVKWSDVRQISPPDLVGDTSEFAQLVTQYDMSFDERVLLILALLPHIRPQALDMLFTRNKNLERGFAEFGGRRGDAHGGFLPTLETAAFVLAGHDLVKRFEIIGLFDRDHFFTKDQVLLIEHPGTAEPFFSAALSVSSETLNLLTTGVRHRPDYSIRFPAKLTDHQLAGALRHHHERMGAASNPEARLSQPVLWSSRHGQDAHRDPHRSRRWR